jgi:hypothetical protein
MKRIPGQASGIKLPGLAGQPNVRHEVDIQARLGNEFTEDGEPVGVMPPVLGVETRRTPTGAVDAYIEMPNLQTQGYRTLAELAEDSSVPEHYLAQVAAENALNRAWAAKGGISIGDDHAGNVMALAPEVASPRPDGSRTQSIDAGISQDLRGSAGYAELGRLRTQAAAILDGYIQLGQRERGERVAKAIESEIDGLLVRPDSTLNGSTRVASLLADGALSDLAAQTEGLNPAGWAAIRREVLAREEDALAKTPREARWAMRAPYALQRELNARAGNLRDERNAQALRYRYFGP